MKLRNLIACLFTSAGVVAGCSSGDYSQLAEVNAEQQAAATGAADTGANAAAAPAASSGTASTQTSPAGSAPTASSTATGASGATTGGSTGSTGSTITGGSSSASSSGGTTTPTTPTTTTPTTSAANPLVSRTVKIWCVGDSMTLGDEATAGSMRSYRGRLYQLLVAAGYSVDFVGTQQLTPAVGGDPDEDAWGGAQIGPSSSTSNNLYDRMPGLLPQVDPDIVIMAFGWNSVYQEPGVAGQKYNNIATLLANAKPNAHLMLATLSPQRGQSEADSTAQVPGYGDLNGVARNLAGASTTDRFWLADYAAAGFQSAEYWDVIHFLQGGADRAAQVIFQSLINGPLKR